MTALKTLPERVAENPELPDDTLETLAQGLIEQFLEKGFSEEQIKGIFRNPLSGGPHSFYRAKGNVWVDALTTLVGVRNRYLRSQHVAM